MSNGEIAFVVCVVLLLCLAPTTSLSSATGSQEDIIEYSSNCLH